MSTACIRFDSGSGISVILRAIIRLASLPEMPTALPPCRLMAVTMSLLMRPASTISTTSTVGLSVTRRPCTNSLLSCQPLQHAGDLRAAAVHDDGVHARLLEQHDVLGEGRRQRRIAHGVAAVLDHHGLPVVALHVRQGFGQDARLQVRGRTAPTLRRRRLPACCFAIASSLRQRRDSIPCRATLGVKHL